MRRASRIILTTPIAAGKVPQRRLALWGSLALVTVALIFVDTDDFFPVTTPQAGTVKSAKRTAAPERREARVVPLLSEPEPLPAGETAEAANDAPATSPARQGPVPALAGVRGVAPASKGAGAPSASFGAPMDGNTGQSAPGDVQDTEASLHYARVSALQPAPAQDDRQVLASALEKCSDEKFLAGVICEQKARLRYCDGKWGQDPQCMPRQRVD